jgi:hypothetical protein
VPRGQRSAGVSRPESPSTARRPALVALVAVLGTICLVLAGCATSETPSYVMLQRSISSTLDKQEAQRPVNSVACSPHVQKVEYSEGIVNLHCVVDFKDGSSYSTPATIEARAFGVAGENYTWEEPPPRDIVKAPLPQPTAPIPATSVHSLFRARNLKHAVAAVAGRFSSKQLILSMALYPSALEAVVGASGEARMVTVSASGTVKLGPVGTFEGAASGIEIAEVDPTVPERLARLISTRGGVPTSELDRFVLAFFLHELDGWDIYATSGQAHFQALLNGEALKQISSSGTRSLD